MAIRDRKNMASPAGTLSAVALMHENIVTKTLTDNTLRMMPLTGFTGFATLKIKPPLYSNHAPADTLK